MLAHPVQALGIFLEVALHGKGVPEGGVRRVVGVVAVLGKAVGRKAVFQAAGHLLQHAQAEFRAVAVKSQTGQGNQGVAAPGVEPVVPGQHRRTARGRFNAELPPHLGQVADEAAAVVVGFGPGPAFGFPDRLQILPVFRDRLGAHGHVDAASLGQGRQGNIQNAGLEQVLAVGEAAFAFLHVFHIVEPVRRGQEGERTTHLHIQGGQAFIGRDAEAPRHVLGAHAQMGIGPGQGMEVPVGQQGLDPQGQRGQLGKALDGPAQQQAACSVDQKHFPAQAHVAHPVGEFGPLVQAETFQIFVPVRVEGPGMLAGGEKELLAAAHDRFLQGGEQHMPSQRRVDREQPVVFARIATQDAAAGIVAQPVGQQPFLAQCSAGVLAGGLVKTEPHTASLAYRVRMMAGRCCWRSERLGAKGSARPVDSVRTDPAGGGTKAGKTRLQKTCCPLSCSAGFIYHIL